ncbi:aminopeptidase N-like [Saccoglossus kowalevskii]|uniref:Aminopeptidase n=1 Tax=Saccoglossus kowalevskii TaxID=10224 RepID=A0ABM0MQ91_SACKO|nr:PREDICTED: aminopeptidase N-like [Saccoglossus kowalevskii]
MDSPKYGSASAADRPDDEPDEKEPLIRNQSPTFPNKCLCTKKGCYITACLAWTLFVCVLLLITFVVLLTFFLGRRHCDETYGLPPEPEPKTTPSFDGRLPETVKPVAYHLNITPYLDEEDGDKRFTFDGDVTIDIDCIHPSNSITLHFLDLRIDTDSVQVTNKSNDEAVAVAGTMFISEYDFLIINLDRFIMTEHQYQIYIRFAGSLNTSKDPDGSWFGFYSSSYETNGETRYLASTKLEPSGARRMFPCFDEPSMKATFDIVVNHRLGRTALSNMPNIRNEMGTEWNTAYFDTSVVMSTYLVAVVVSDFVNMKTITANGVQFRVWSTADYSHGLTFSLEFGNQSLTDFEQLWGIPYSLPKMDMVALPVFDAGAMENWGLITYKDYRMLYDDTIHSPSHLQSVALVIAHELVHMWFGNFVTLAWWDDTWLNEGFARFYEIVGVNNILPEWKMFDQFYQQIVTFDAFSADSSYESHPTVRPVGWFNEQKEQFSKQSYERGAAMIMMMQWFLGKDVFHDGIVNYLNDKLYSNAVTDDLWRHLTTADRGHGNNDVKEIMDPWLLQVGYPIVTVKRSDNTVEAQQKRFLLDPHDEPGQYHDLGPWSIPVSYIHSNKLNEPELVWIKGESARFDLTGARESDWFLVNINQMGYYRVNYDNDNWSKLINQLKTKHSVISIRNRAALVDDVFNIAQSLDVGANVSLDMMEYLIKEVDYAPWKAVENALLYSDRMLKRTAVYGDFRKYVKTQINPMYNRLGWNLTTQDHIEFHNVALSIRLACYYGNRECIVEAQKKFSNWKLNPDMNRITEDVRATVLCIGLMYGDEEDWQSVFSFLQKTNDDRLSADLKQGLACSRLPWVLQNYMEEYLDRKEIVNVVSKIRDTSTVGFLLAWDFMVQHFDKLKEIHGDKIYDLVWGFSDTMNTLADKDKYDDFGRKYNTMPNDNAIGFYKGLRKINTNIEWMDKNYDDIVNFLNNKLI